MSVFRFLLLAAVALLHFCAATQLRGLQAVDTAPDSTATVAGDSTEADKIANCWDISDERTCTSVSDCFWDFRYPCNDATTRCWEIKDEGSCAAAHDCYWNPRAKGDYGDANCKRKNRILQSCPKCRRK